MANNNILGIYCNNLFNVLKTSKALYNKRSKVKRPKKIVLSNNELGTLYVENISEYIDGSDLYDSCGLPATKLSL